MCSDLSHIYTEDAYFMCFGCFIPVVIFNNLNDKTEGTNVIYSFIEYVCYDLKHFDVSH